MGHKMPVDIQSPWRHWGSNPEHMRNGTHLLCSCFMVMEDPNTSLLVVVVLEGNNTHVSGLHIDWDVSSNFSGSATVTVLLQSEAHT